MFRFITVLLICILSGAEIDLFIPSFPELRHVFSLTPFMVQLTLSTNFIAYCVSCIFTGAMGDRYNRRHVMLASLFGFVLGSVFCVAASNFSMLVLGRFLQGAGMAGPAVLAYAVISDGYPLEKQPAMLGTLNGIITIAMAFAPVLGSYINLYFGWRGNFWLLLILGVICLVTSYFALPSRKGDPTISLSPTAYVELLKSKPLLLFVASICFLILPYWLFIGISPILYMENLGVSLQHFGFYQGAIAGIFAMVSLMSPKLLNIFGQKKCLYFGITLCLIAAILTIPEALYRIEHPMLITAVLMIMAAGVLFPVNIIFPAAMMVIENTKGRASALIMAGRLILTGLGLQAVSYFYDGTYFLIGLAIAGSLLLSMLLIRLLIVRKWLVL